MHNSMESRKEGRTPGREESVVDPSRTTAAQKNRGKPDKAIGTKSGAMFPIQKNTQEGQSPRFLILTNDSVKQRFIIVMLTILALFIAVIIIFSMQRLERQT